METTLEAPPELKEEVTYDRWDPSYPFDMRGRVRPILVWRFHDAPEEIQTAANQGGDESWLAILPPERADDWPLWAETGTPFGCCCVNRVKLPDGGVILVGCHA